MSALFLERLVLIGGLLQVGGWVMAYWAVKTGKFK